MRSGIIGGRLGAGLVSGEEADRIRKNALWDRLPSSHDLGSDVPYQFQLDRQVQRLYLEDLRLRTNLSPNLAMLRLLILPAKKVKVAVRAILDNPPTEAEFQRRLELVEAILVNKFPQLSFEEVRQMLDLKEVNFSETRFYQDVLQKGREEGREQEREQGLQREAELVLRLLQRRCGVLGIDRQELVRSLPITSGRLRQRTIRSSR